MTPRRCGAALAALLLLAGCAALPPGKRDPRDPFERFNRSVYRFNTAADHALLRPAARAWRAAVPRPVRTGLGNFVGNLGYPRTVVNDLLQGKLADGGKDFSRLLINTIFGLGFFDPATRAGLERHDEDFGQTLGKWGVPSGPYLMLPLFGPSTMRDAPARIPDEYLEGRHYIKDPYARWSLVAVDVLEARAGLLDADAVLERSYDPYAFVRNAWLQRREFQVRDGNVEEDLLLEDDSPPADAPAPDAQPAAAPPAAAPPAAAPPAGAAPAAGTPSAR